MIESDVIVLINLDTFLINILFFDKLGGSVEDKSKAKQEKLSRLEIIAVSSSIGIISVGVAYWIMQIRGVLEMLEMAYG